MKLKLLLLAVTYVSLAIVYFRIICYYSTEHVKSYAEGIEEGPYPSDRLEHLIWFIHISDLHFSLFHDPGRQTDFDTFCKININAIKPQVVLATGDITDAKLENLYDSRQFIEEWKAYKGILDKYNASQKTIWLDIRGNHDNFNVYSVHSSQNFFRNFSVQGPKYISSYVYELENDGDKYTFIGVDACLKTGLRRPFNFIGILTQEDYAWLEKKAAKYSHSNGTIWFGHFPTSTVLSPKPGIRHLMRNGLGYFCGHLHTMHDIVPKMQAVHHNGLLELEVGDWKDYRRYRVAAIDHNMLSFVDLNFGEWPVILITNPKHAGYVASNVEPIYRIKKSTHIRILVFSPFEILSVQVKIGDSEWQHAYSNKHPLYILPWDPLGYNSGLHDLQVQAQDSAGNKMLQRIVFSLDGSAPDIPMLGRIALMSHVTWFQVLFGSQLFMLVIPLSVLKLIRPIYIDRCAHWFKAWLSNLQIMVKVDCLFYPIMALIIYPAIGPLFIGSMSEGHLGIVFVWGILLHKEFIPGSLTFLYSSFQVLFFQIPLILSITQCIHYKVRPNQSPSFTVILQKYTFLAVAIIYQIKMTCSFQKSYGPIAAILSFAYSWFAAFALILWYIANTLPKNVVVPSN